MSERIQKDMAAKRQQWIRCMVYGVAFCMPLYTLAGDMCAWMGALLAFWDRWQLRSGWGTFRHSRLALWVVAFLLWSGLSTLNSMDPVLSGYSWLYHMGTYAIVYGLTAGYLRTEGQWRMLLRTMIAAAVVVCVLGIYEYFFYTHIGIGQWVDESQFPGIQRRMYSTLQNPNLLGEYLLMAVSISGIYVVRLLQQHAWKKASWLGVFVAMSLLCIVLTYSRGIWVSVMCVVIYAGLVVDRRLLWTLLLVPLILFCYHGGISTRLWSLFSGQDTSSSLRWALWDSTSYMIEEHPILGIGWDSYWFVYPHYNYFIQAKDVIIYHAHNMYLNVMAETGIIGAICYFAAMYVHAWAAWRIPRHILRGVLTYGIPGMILGISVSGLVDHDLFSHQVSTVYWQWLGLVCAVSTSVDKDKFI